MKIKKLFCTTLGLLIFGYASLHSQSITVNEKGRIKTNYTLKEISKITFSNNGLIINKKIGTSQIYSLSNFNVVEFQNIYSGINFIGKTTNAMLSYPNPVKNSLTLLIPSSQTENMDLSLMSLDGKVVYQTKISNSFDNKSFTIDMSGFEKGIYIYKIQSNSIISTNKIVKK